MSGYAVTAQYYDPLAQIARADTDRRIAAALAPLGGLAGPVIDIGAGTGLCTALIAATLPGCEILAVEPHPVMRAALMARVCALQLHDQVTILPFDIFTAPLPDAIGGAVLSASLVHFSAADRAQLWPILARRLSSAGLVIVEVQCPEAVTVNETVMATANVGRMSYRGSARAERIAPDQQRWHMTYCAHLDDEEIASQTACFDCWTATSEQILAEASSVGLSGSVSGDIVLLHR